MTTRKEKRQARIEQAAVDAATSALESGASQDEIEKAAEQAAWLELERKGKVMKGIRSAGWEPKWTPHTFRCQGCGHFCYASEQGIAAERQAMQGVAEYQAQTDAEIVNAWQFCCLCSAGEAFAGERVIIGCDGCEQFESAASDRGYLPASERSDPAELEAYLVLDGGKVSTAVYCPDCKREAQQQGANVMRDE